MFHGIFPEILRRYVPFFSRILEYFRFFRQLGRYETSRIFQMCRHFFLSSFWKIRWTFFKVRSEIWRQEGISTTLPIFLSQPLQVAWSDFWKTGNSRVGGSHWFHWVSETVPLQKVQLSWGPFPFKLQVGTLHLLLVGCVEQDQRGDWGADLPNVDLGGGIWGHPWSFSWVFFYFVLGQLQRYQKNCYKPVVNNWSCISRLWTRTQHNERRHC